MLRMKGYANPTQGTFFETTRFVSVDWVACDTCYTKTDGTELGGIERTELDFPGVMPKIKKKA